MNLADVSVYSLLVLNQDNKLAPQVDKMCFPFLLASLLPFRSLHLLCSLPMHLEEMRKQGAGRKSALKSPIQIPRYLISSMFVRERQRSRERGEGGELAAGCG